MLVVNNGAGRILTSDVLHVVDLEEENASAGIAESKRSGLAERTTVLEKDVKKILAHLHLDNSDARPLLTMSPSI